MRTILKTITSARRTRQCSAVPSCSCSRSRVARRVRARPGAGHKIRIIAGENFWGSIATQLAGSDGDVTSIITNPATDPHDYEATAADAQTVASAQLVIENGIGYDGWMQHLLDANPISGRVVLNVGDLLGIRAVGIRTSGTREPRSNKSSHV